MKKNILVLLLICLLINLLLVLLWVKVEDTRYDFLFLLLLHNVFFVLSFGIVFWTCKPTFLSPVGELYAIFLVRSVVIVGVFVVYLGVVDNSTLTLPTLCLSFVLYMVYIFVEKYFQIRNVRQQVDKQ